MGVRVTSLDARRREGEVRTAVRDARSQRDARQTEAVCRRDHRLIGQIDDRIRLVALDARRRAPPSAVSAATIGTPYVSSPRLEIDLLGPAEERRGHDLVLGRELVQSESHDRRVVLAVDESDDPCSCRRPPRRLAVVIAEVIARGFRRCRDSVEVIHGRLSGRQLQ